jgi:hypothetical protein
LCSFGEFHARDFMLLDCSKLVALRFSLHRTPYRNENENRRDCAERGNRDAPFSIPRDFSCSPRIACTLLGASDVRQQQLASHAIGKMRLQSLAFRRVQRPVAVCRQRCCVGALRRRRTWLRAHRTAQYRIERLAILIDRRHHASLPFERTAAGKLHCARRFI